MEKMWNECNDMISEECWVALLVYFAYFFDFFLHVGVSCVPTLLHILTRLPTCIHSACSTSWKKVWFLCEPR